MILSLPYESMNRFRRDSHFVETVRVIEVSSGCQPHGDSLARKVSQSLYSSGVLTNFE